MAVNINAEIVAIGTEILLGEIADTNSVFIARLLRDIGVNLYFMTSVGDNEQRIADSIRIALSRADIVITCGGLGPTIDDMTRQAVALATNRSLEFHQYLLDAIAARFATFRAQMTDNNRRQAYLPYGAIVIENPVGTAPSFIVEQDGKCVISLPGVPREMKFLMNERVVPYLREHYGLGSEIIKAKVLKTAGIGESMLDDQIGTELLEMANPTVGLAAHAGQVDVRITAKASSEPEADEMIGAVEQRIRQRIGSYIFGVDTDRIQDVLVKLLLSSGMRLSVSEIGIDDFVHRAVLDTPSGDRVIADHQHYADLDALNISMGGQGTQSIRELAEITARHSCRDDASVAAIVIVTDPMRDESEDSDGGTAIAVCAKGNMRSRIYGFGGRSEIAASWTTTWAMSMLWQMLSET